MAPEPSRKAADSEAADVVRIVVVDDHALSRRQLIDALERQPGLLVIGEAADGPTGLRRIEQLAPDVALLDVRLPGMDGFTLARRLRVAGGPPVVLISAYQSPRYRDAAAAAGAVALLAKSDSEERLAAAMRMAAGRVTEVDP